MSEQLTLVATPDICRNMHGGNEQSEAANRRVHPHKLTKKKQILAAIEREGTATCLEIEEMLNMKHQSCSARITELLAEKKVERTGDTRNGYSVLRIYAAGV